MIRHLLLIRFKPTATPEAVAAVWPLFEAIPSQVEGVVAVEWGRNNSPEGLDRGYTHAVLMTFADEAVRQNYLPHPAHEALKQVFVPLLEDIIVIDYPCQGG